MALRVTKDKFRRMVKRQGEAEWGPSYQPSNLSTRTEAPSVSRVTRLQSMRLGRVVHLQSEPEFAAALLALYHPNLVGIQEQRMLSPVPAPHPLANHPAIRGELLPSFRGTLEVIDRIDARWRHPVVEIDGNTMPLPFVGDLLLAMVDEQGIYCVNWTVKKTLSGFENPMSSTLRKGPSGEQQRNKIMRRQKMEQLYYEDAGIRTQRVTQQEIPAGLFSNLRMLFQWHGRPIVLDKEKVDEIVQDFTVCLITGIPPQTLIGYMSTKYECSIHDILTIFYRGIWERRLQVDLFIPILVDKKLNQEKLDVTEKYNNWFAR